MRTANRFGLLAIVIGTVATTGCASILSKSHYPVAIDSVPAQANFVVKDRRGQTVAEGQTPATVTLAAKQGFFRSAQYQVQFEKAGYVSKDVPLKGTLDEWYLGNVFAGGLVGMLIVDPATGAMWELPEHATAELAENLAPSTGVQQASHTESRHDKPVEHD